MRRKIGGVAILAALIVGLMPLTALAHDFGGDGNCDGWTITLDGTYGAHTILIDGQAQGSVQLEYVIPDGSGATSRSFTVKWDKDQGDVTRVHSLNRDTSGCEEEPIEQEVFAVFECLVRQGVGLPLFTVEGRPGAEFIVNGVHVGGAGYGLPAQFGVNTWQAVALDGYVIVGETSGEAVIEDCTPAATTTTTVPVTEVTEPTTPPPTQTVAAPPTTVGVTEPPSLVELPFTGPDDRLIGAGFAALALGSILLLAARRRDEETVG